MLNACTIFAQTPVYDKDLHSQGNHLHQRQGGGSLFQPASTLCVSSAKVAEATHRSW